MPMEVITIKADNIDGAAREIIGFLEDTSKGNVIHFDGWVGLGASAVLKVVAKRLGSSSGAAAGTAGTVGFDKIIHVDCSLWESKRALQKAIAEELGLPQSVMAIFGQRDEDDDFNGVEQGSRGVIQDVTGVIFRTLMNRRLLVVFHNGSGGYIDLYECGVPIIPHLSNKVLWTSRGRFRLQNCTDEVEKIAGLSDVAIRSTWSNIPELRCEEAKYDKVWDLLREEAKEVARYTGITEPDMNHKIVEECILYKWWALRDDDCGIDWGTHAPNYWICDGIIQTTKDDDRSAWEIGNALHINMRLDWHQHLASFIGHAIEHYRWRPNDLWVSDKQGAVQVPPQATSFFRTAAEPSIANNATAILPAGMFDRSGKSRLRVIQLSRCAFSFSSPPFLCCSNLRFLLLHHCKDNDDGTTTHHGGEKEHQSHSGHNGGPWRACFQNLWVLDLSYTDWYQLLSEEMMDVMADLRELNVKGVKRWSISHLRCGGGAGSSSCRLLNLGKLRVTEAAADIGGDHRNDINQASSVVLFPDLSNSSSLKTIVLDGFVMLEKLGPDAMPPSLESFSFFNNVAEESVEEPEDNSTAAKINSISFQGCAQLKSLLLRGLFGSLAELNMSGTAVKTLDLSAMQAPRLRRLFLLGCVKLRAILWPREVKKLTLDMLRIDTTRAGWSGEEKSSEEPGDATGSRSSSITMLQVQDHYIFIRDGRLLRSLRPVSHRLVRNNVHIEISSSRRASAATAGVVASGSKCSNSRGAEKQVPAILKQPTANLYVDVADASKDQPQAGPDNKGDGDTPTTMWMRPCPTVPTLGADKCYLQGSEGTSTTTFLDFICDNALILHVHDSLSITSIDGPARQVGSKWEYLIWCRLERCPKIEGSVFANPLESDSTIFDSLRTFWASQLLKARYIWNWSTSFQPDEDSFEDLEFLHLDYCPRLIHVLPLSTSMTLDELVTLEIVYCGDLKEVFPLHPGQIEDSSTMNFPKLRYLHLHELPMLQCIRGRRMSAPELETVKIRGCWSLRRLPAIGRRSEPLEVDCEKEWWDGLEWDGVEAGHHPSLYKPRHSPYYKKTLPRGSILR